MRAASSPSPLDHERSSRRDLWVWAMLLVAGAFIYAGYSIDPLQNCSEGGECAPWLVPIAAGMGWCALAMALGLLWANPSRGCRIDPASGDLLWWKNRTSQTLGDTGRIHPSGIASIRLHLGDDTHSVSLYGTDGERLGFFDEEVIPWPYDRWAERLARTYPHIRIDRIG